MSKLDDLEQGVERAGRIATALSALWGLVTFWRKPKAPRSDEHDMRCGVPVGPGHCERFRGHAGEHVYGSHRR